MISQRRFRVQSAKEQYAQIYGIIAEVVEELGLSGHEKFRFAVCVTEAFTNAFYHGNRAEPEMFVDLLFSWDEEQLTIEVLDQGSGRAADIDLSLDVKEVPTEKTSGRGMAIIRKFADKVQVTERDGGGLRVMMIMQRRRGVRTETSTHLS